MDRNTAVRKLNKLLGKGFGYRTNAKAPTPEEREAAKAKLPAAIAERDRLRKEAQARYEAVLKADPEYQALVAARKEASRRVDDLSGVTRHYAITVGTTIMDGMFFSGDNWQEVVDKVTKKKTA